MRMTKRVKAGFLQLRPEIAIAVETPSDNVEWCCRCPACKHGEEDCECAGRKVKCEECTNHENAMLALQWLDEHVFNR